MTPLASVIFSLCALFLSRPVAGQPGSLTSAYAPTYVSCPSNVTWLRPPKGISDDERAWVMGRKAVVVYALADYLSNLSLSDFRVDEYVNAIMHDDLKNVPVLSLAISGGGDVAAFTGIGIMQAFDSRSADAIAQRTGGVLQSLTYLAGLSGGSWPTTGFSVSNFPTIPELIQQWQPEIDPFARGDNASAVEAYFNGIFEDIAAKAEEGFPVSLGDFLARAISSEVVPGPDYGAGVTWSGVRKLSKFMNYTMPMPILEFLVVPPTSPTYGGIPIPPTNSTLIECTPFEFGTWQGDRTGFTPTEYLGTLLVAGAPGNTSECVNGFDNAGFMLGTSSNAWNLWYINDISNGTAGGFAKRALTADTPRMRDGESLHKRGSFSFPIDTIEELAAVFNQSFNLSLPDIMTAPYFNPWLGINGDNETFLQLVDGSEGGQTIPLAGVMQPARSPDFIIAYDASQETDYDWQNGTNLIDTAAFAASHGIPFPKIPTAVTMLNRNYTIRPTFFGCNSSLASGLGNGTSPIVLYLSNAPYSAYTNFSFIQNALPMAQVHDVLQNSFNIVTQGNGTIDDEWPECLGCAIIQRSIERLGWETTAQCSQCFAKYCWDGTDDAKLGAGLSPFDPRLLLPPMQDYADWNLTHQYNFTSS